MEYTFFITTLSSVSTEVHPLNWLECSLVWEKEGDNVFYRQKFEGSLTFGGKKLCADFNYFYSFETVDPCELLYLTIYKDGVLYWEGYFSTGQGEWDLDAQTFTVTPLTLDGYFEWDKEGDTQYNLLQYLTPETVNFDDGSDTETYEQCLSLADVIEYLAQKLDATLSWAGGTIVSEFLTNATNPITNSTNKYNHIFISQKSDIKRPNSTNPATVGMMSFNELMEILKCMNLRWDYDADLNILTIEHVSAWESVDTLDIRTIELAISTNKYKYLTEEMPKYEKFAWMEANNRDFIGEPIWYDATCVNQDSDSNETNLTLNVTTDFDYIRTVVNMVPAEDSKISDDGWVLLATMYIAPDYYLMSSLGVIETTVSHFNNDLSWSALHNRFFKHDRQLMNGYMNGSLTDFYSARKTKQQECSIIYCSTLNPELNITTELGETYFGGVKGDIRKAVIKPYGEINLTLNYGPAESEVVPEPEAKTIYIWESRPAGDPASGTCGQLFATLSEPATVGFNLYISNVVRDNMGVIQCTSVPETWAFNIGDVSGSFLVTFCMAIPAGGCWESIDDWSEAEALGWTVTGIDRNEWITDCPCL